MFWLVLIAFWLLPQQDPIVRGQFAEVLQESGIWTMDAVFSLSDKDHLQSLLTLYLHPCVWSSMAVVQLFVSLHG